MLCLEVCGGVGWDEQQRQAVMLVGLLWGGFCLFQGFSDAGTTTCLNSCCWCHHRMF